MNVYLAGKISKNDWRRELVDRLNTVSLERWASTKQLRMTTGDVYVGRRPYSNRSRPEIVAGHENFFVVETQRSFVLEQKEYR